MSVIIREKKLKDGRISLYLDIYDRQGNRSYQTLYLYLSGKRGNPADKEVRQKADHIRLDMELKQMTGEDSPRQKQLKSMVCFFAFLDNSIKRRRVNGPLICLRGHLKKYLKTDQLPIHQIDKKLLLDFQDYLTELGTLVPNTVNGLMKKFSTQLNEAKAEELITVNPFHNVPRHQRVKYKAPPINPLFPEDVRLLMDSTNGIPAQVTQCFFTALFTGLRWSDASNLKKEQIQTALIDGKRRKMLAIIIQKGGKPTHLPLSAEAVHYIALRRSDERRELNAARARGEKMRQSDAVFPRFAEGNPRLTYNYMRMHLSRWAKRSGLTKRLNFHLARHSFATLLLPLVKDIRVIQKLLCHADIATTQRYAFVLDSYQAASVDELSQHRFLSR